MKAMKAPDAMLGQIRLGQSACMDSPVALCCISTLGRLKTMRSFFHSASFACFMLEVWEGALVARGMQAMKKADAEEAPAMKSMKAMKACSLIRSVADCC